MKNKNVIFLNLRRGKFSSHGFLAQCAWEILWWLMNQHNFYITLIEDDGTKKTARHNFFAAICELCSMAWNGWWMKAYYEMWMFKWCQSRQFLQLPVAMNTTLNWMMFLIKKRESWTTFRKIVLNFKIF
jgi:hypothetical protein